MPERVEALRKILAQLRDQLEDGEPLRPEARAVLEEAISQIQATLEAAQASPPPTAQDTQPTLLDRISQLAEDFEETHPRLSATMGRVADALSNLGI